MPWVNALEFRTRNNELLYNRQQYALRLDIENPLKVIQNKRYFETQQQLSNLKREHAIKNELTKRYLMLIQLMEIKSNFSIRIKGDSLAQRLFDAIRSKVGLPGFDGSDLIDAKLDIISRQADLREAEFDFSDLELRITRLSGLTGGEIKDLGVHLQPSQISLVFDSIRQGLNLVEVMEKAKAVELAARKMAVDKASYTMGWVQGMYVPYKREEGERPSGLALGLTIPIFNKNKDDQARDQLEVLEKEAELEQLKFDVGEQWVSRKESLRHLLEQYRSVSKQLETLKNADFKALSITADYDPVPGIKLNLELIKFDLLLNKIRYSVMREWIHLLDESDIIGQFPLRNYLSSNFERLD